MRPITVLWGLNTALRVLLTILSVV